jgi:hypothetical protein
LVLLKRAFYRGWTAKMDGTPLPTYRVSPGLQMNLIPAGTHQIWWTYEGPNHRVASFLALAVGVLLGLLGWAAGRSTSVRAAGRSLDEKLARWRRPLPPMLRRLLPTAVLAAFLLVIAWKAAAEVLLGIPVTIFPKPGQAITLMEHDGADVHWNLLTGRQPREQQAFKVQIARDPRFSSIVATSEVKADHARLRGPFVVGDSYYFRIKCQPSGGDGRWTTPVRFVVAGRDR